MKNGSRRSYPRARTRQVYRQRMPRTREALVELSASISMNYLPGTGACAFYALVRNIGEKSPLRSLRGFECYGLVATVIQRICAVRTFISETSLQFIDSAKLKVWGSVRFAHAPFVLSLHQGLV